MNIVFIDTSSVQIKSRSLEIILKSFKGRFQVWQIWKKWRQWYIYTKLYSKMWKNSKNDQGFKWLKVGILSDFLYACLISKGFHIVSSKCLSPLKSKIFYTQLQD